MAGMAIQPPGGFDTHQNMGHSKSWIEPPAIFEPMTPRGLYGMYGWQRSPLPKPDPQEPDPMRENMVLEEQTILNSYKNQKIVPYDGVSMSPLPNSLTCTSRTATPQFTHKLPVEEQNGHAQTEPSFDSPKASQDWQPKRRRANAPPPSQPQNDGGGPKHMLAHLALTPPLTGGELSLYVERTWQERSSMLTPHWAEIYEAGHLEELGLKTGVFDVDYDKLRAPDHLRLPDPETIRKRIRHGPHVQGTVLRAETIELQLYVLLKRIPGNRMKLDAIYQITLEWTGEDRKPPAKKSFRGSCKSTLSRNDQFFWMEDEKDPNGEAWWSVGERSKKYEKGSGGRKHKLTSDKVEKPRGHSHRAQGKQSDEKTSSIPSIDSSGFCGKT